ncbi:enoyl-ACP reductase (plasmid) [Skermanella sp. TT6]|uniref:Enoyl-[acyl-carrier-protein] reductase [NADH] n=1 Tax=Skermanella cutis TaxID=2775420 RepID=A0ABX7BJM5_9PROT|nr:enoyl-ACP reductase [Skermanella sp. TT6]QQP93454.1 enoyl-ACP reductase [Skermanella sp. TT6]
MTGMMAGKAGLIVGVANQRSIAWGIAQTLRNQGATIGLTYANPQIEKQLRGLAPRLGVEFLAPCDVRDDDQVKAACDAFAERHGGIDFIVHAVAFAPGDELANGFINTSRAAFELTMDVSAYSLVSLCRHARPHFKPGAGVLSLSYLGSERVCVGYNLMGVAKAALESAARYLAADLGADGVRVNVISAGPVRTLAALGLPNFREMLEKRASQSPLPYNVSLEDIGNSALFLLSDMSRSTTGSVVWVDAGYNIMGSWSEADARAGAA